MSDTAHSVRPGWSGLPFVVQIELEQRLGATVVNSESQTSGFATGLASRLELTDGGRVFVKGVPASHPLIRSYQAEAHVCACLPDDSPTPLLLGTVDDEWFLLVFQDVDGYHPDLRPGSPDVSAVLASLQTLRGQLTPCPLPGLATAEAVYGPRLTGWSHLVRRLPHDLDPWARRNIDKLAALETAWLPWAGGDTMLHMDLRPDNVICRYEDGVALIVDWAAAVRGAAWLEPAALVSHLIMAGHSPAEAERVALASDPMSNVPAWALTGFAAGIAGHWAASSRQPSPPGAYGLRAFQSRAAAAALAWVAYRTRWA
jgi:aminoglycoside phosphotransferase (APT) family kinase protein